MSALPGAKLENLFPVPFLSHLWPDSAQVNAELARIVLEKADRVAGSISNRGGWQSPYTLQEWPQPPFRTLVARMESMIAEMVLRQCPKADERHLRNWKISAWANVNPPGAFNASHDHSRDNNIWSGVYYVDVGRQDGNAPLGGRTIFEDHSLVPKEALLEPNPFARETVIQPENGLMVLFPGSLYHRVEPYRGVGDRITIAFNASHPGYVVPKYLGMEELNWRWKYFLGPMMTMQYLRRRARRLVGRGGR